MGNLVFQATLGGQVNLVGPNTSSTYNINVPAVAGNLVTTGDTATVTNTMLASNAYTAPGTIGSGTPNTGAFTTLTASTSVVSPIHGAASGSALSLQSNGTTNATLDTNGNLGLGVTPSAWSGAKAFQTGSGGIATTALWDVNNNTFLTNGAYWNGSSYIYVASSFPAARYVQNSGAHTWSTAAGGTAGSAISFTQAMTLDNNGNLLVGATSAANGEKLYATTNSSQNIIGARFGASASNATAFLATNTTGATNFDYIGCYNGSGTGQFRVSSSGVIYAQNTTVQSISDSKVKTNVRDLDYGLEKIIALTPRRFDFIEGWGANKTNVMGFIAQEVEAVIPEIIDETKFGGFDSDETHKTLGLTDLIPVLVKAIQEQQALITTMQSQITDLQAKLKSAGVAGF